MLCSFYLCRASVQLVLAVLSSYEVRTTLAANNIGYAQGIVQQATFHQDCDWSEYFSDAKEDIPLKSPEPYGKEFKRTVYVDADHAHNIITRRLVTEILLLINNTLLVWMSKRQRTVETSTFGSEMIAARITVDLIIKMRYKLRCLGIPVERCSELLGDNLSCIINTTVLSSKVKKKHLSCYIMHVYKALAAGLSILVMFALN